MCLYCVLLFFCCSHTAVWNPSYISYISGTLLWVEKLKWKNADTWKNSVRRPLVVEDIVEGYFKAQDNFRMYWVNRAGHMVRTYKALSLVPRSFRIYYKPRAVDPRLICYKENPKSACDFTSADSLRRPWFVRIISHSKDFSNRYFWCYICKATRTWLIRCHRLLREISEALVSVTRML